jgi:hypothetical protein
MSRADDENPSDSQVSLLGVYATQFSSYSSLLWQVPALGLTAQSFLLTIALTHDSSQGARIMASGLGLLIALASVALMHGQRGFAISHAWFVRQLSIQLGLGELAGIKESDAEPQLETRRVGDAEPDPVSLSTRTNKNLREFLKKRLKLRIRQIPEVAIDAVSIWQVPHLIYHVWRWCMIAFMVADVVIIISSVRGYSWFG